MHTLTTLEFTGRLAVGLGCGALIGVERQWRARMAGLRGMSTTHSEQDAETSLSAHPLPDGDAPVRLEQIVARLSLEPGIHAVHWHIIDEAGDPEPKPDCV